LKNRQGWGTPNSKQKAGHPPRAADVLLGKRNIGADKMEVPICSPLIARASFFRSQFRQGTFSGYQNNNGFRERHLHLTAVVGVGLFQMEAVALLYDLPVDLEWVPGMFQRRIQAATDTSQTRPIIKSKSQAVPDLVRDHKGLD
jgi:hypothetical protein